jgi:hypothetical protein
MLRQESAALEIYSFFVKLITYPMILLELWDNSHGSLLPTLHMKIKYIVAVIAELSIIT